MQVGSPRASRLTLPSSGRPQSGFAALRPQAGEPCAEISENVMHRSHALLQAAKQGSISTVVGAGTVADFLGKRWVRTHPKVWPHIQVLEALELGADGA
jgi:hypothetical protein